MLTVTYTTYGSFGQHSAHSYIFINEKGPLDVESALSLGIIRLVKDETTRSRKNIYMRVHYELVEDVGVIEVSCSASSSKHEHEVEILKPGDFSLEEFEEPGKYVIRMPDGREFIFNACARRGIVQIKPFSTELWKAMKKAKEEEELRRREAPRIELVEHGKGVAIVGETYHVRELLKAAFKAAGVKLQWDSRERFWIASCSVDEALRIVRNAVPKAEIRFPESALMKGRVERMMEGLSN
ncbi:MAG: hypothetical protein QXJ48_02335 [Candidatus Korarchaeum sp.]